jgi:primosomal protein N'
MASEVPRCPTSNLAVSEKETQEMKPLQDLEAALACLSLETGCKSTLGLESRAAAASSGSAGKIASEKDALVEQNAVVSFVDDVEPLDECVKPLRQYQARLIRKVTRVADKFFQKTVKKVQSTLIYLPTGGGKTRIASELIRNAVLRGQRCLFVVNRNKLATQVMY